MLALSGAGGWLSILRVDDGSVQRLRGIPENVGVGRPAFGEGGRLIAAGIVAGPLEEKVIRVWDLESVAVRTFGPLAGAGNGLVGGINDVAFIGRDRLLAAVLGPVSCRST